MRFTVELQIPDDVAGRVQSVEADKMAPARVSEAFLTRHVIRRILFSEPEAITIVSARSSSTAVAGTPRPGAALPA